MKMLKSNQTGFVTEIVVVLALLVAVVTFVFMRVSNAN
jgi:hypothetical protein